MVEEQEARDARWWRKSGKQEVELLLFLCWYSTMYKNKRYGKDTIMKSV